MTTGQPARAAKTAISGSPRPETSLIISAPAIRGPVGDHWAPRGPLEHPSSRGSSLRTARARKQPLSFLLRVDGSGPRPCGFRTQVEQVRSLLGPSEPPGPGLFHGVELATVRKGIGSQVEGMPMTSGFRRGPTLPHPGSPGTGCALRPVQSFFPGRASAEQKHEEPLKNRSRSSRGGRAGFPVPREQGRFSRGRGVCAQRSKGRASVKWCGKNPFRFERDAEVPGREDTAEEPAIYDGCWSGGPPIKGSLRPWCRGWSRRRGIPRRGEGRGNRGQLLPGHQHADLFGIQHLAFQ